MRVTSRRETTTPISRYRLDAHALGDEAFVGHDHLTSSFYLESSSTQAGVERDLSVTGLQTVAALEQVLASLRLELPSLQRRLLVADQTGKSVLLIEGDYVHIPSGNGRSCASYCLLLVERFLGNQRVQIELDGTVQWFDESQVRADAEQPLRRRSFASAPCASDVVLETV